MPSNKYIRELLIERYGAECFIERLHLRDTSRLTYKGKKQYQKMKMLTFHHIKPKSKGGRTSVDNGSILSNENHQWFHQQSEEEQERMNREFQRLKQGIDELKVIFTDDVDTTIRVIAAELIIEERERGKERGEERC